MKRMAYLLLAVAVLSIAAHLARASKSDGGEADPIFGITIPSGYRDWKLISVAHEAGNNNDIRAILGNDAAVNAYRDGKLPFPDGAIIARLAWNYVSSEENNKVFGRPQSFVAGAATNVQFMVKDSRKYASTGGWGFAQFKDGKPDGTASSKLASLATSLSKLATLFTRATLRYAEVDIIVQFVLPPMSSMRSVCRRSTAAPRGRSRRGESSMNSNESLDNSERVQILQVAFYFMAEACAASRWKFNWPGIQLFGPRSGWRLAGARKGIGYRRSRGRHSPMKSRP